MTKKIQRIPHPRGEDDRAAEIQKLTDDLRRAQTKHTLAKLYEKVLDYGSDLVLRECKCVDNQESERFLIEDDPLLGEPSCLIEPKQHNPEETLKKNAKFLVESSRKLPDYSPELLHCMEDAFERSDFQAVIEFAIQNDSYQRRQRTKFDRESDQGKTKEQIQHEINEVERELSVSCNWGALLDEILAEKPLEKTALGHCVTAMKALSGELTYDSRSKAKESLAKAVVMLESEDES